jgi:hypothetical protein
LGGPECSTKTRISSKGKRTICFGEYSSPWHCFSISYFLPIYFQQAGLNVASNIRKNKRKISERKSDDKNDENESLLSKRCRRKIAPPPTAKSRKVVDFVLTEETPFLTLIGGISTLRRDIQPNHTGTSLSKSIQDYRRMIVQHDSIELPNTECLLELPMSCQSGKWKAEIVPELEYDTQPTPNTVDKGNGDVATLHGYRICLRHESRYTLGKLLFDTVEQQNSSNRATGGRSRGHPNRTNEEPTIRVTSIYPSENRIADVLGRRQNAQSKDHPNPIYIGAIAVVGCADTLNSRTRTFTQSLSMAKHTPQHLKDQPSLNGAKPTIPADSEYPILFKVSNGRPGHSSGVGFSVPCGLPLEASYYLRYAQDFSLEKKEITAIDCECI